MDQLVQIVNCLTKEECDTILGTINFNNFQVSSLINSERTSKSTHCIDLNVRSSTSLTLDENSEIAQLLHNNINKSLLLYKEKIININEIFNYYPIPGGIGVNCYREPIQVLRYQRGQKYQFHHDISGNKHDPEYYRMISVIVYLNDEFKGGGTEFPHQVIKPMKGQAIIFPSSWTHPHMGQEVIEGQKFVAVTWYYSDQL